MNTYRGPGSGRFRPVQLSKNDTKENPHDGEPERDPKNGCRSEEYDHG